MLIKIEQKLRRRYENAFFKDHKIRYTLLKRLWKVSKTLCCASASLRVYTSKFSKCDVLLINPAKPDSEKGIPVGIATIAAYLQKYGIKTYLLDMNLNKISSRSLLFLIRKTKPLIIGMGAITYQVDEVYQLGRLIKKELSEVTLVYGGVHSTFVTKEAFKAGSADFVVMGEGEQTLTELAQTLKDGQIDFSKIAGLAYVKEGVVIRNKQRQFIKDLNSLPFPAYYNLKLKAYNTDIHIQPHNKKIAVDLVESRGCPNNCRYCATPQLYYHHTRLKDAKNIIAELESLQKKEGIRYFHFHDDNFLIDRQRAIKLCQLIAKKGMKIMWICLTDINTLKRSKDLIPKLAGAGCIGIEVGLENADTEVLKGLKRQQDIYSLPALDRLMKKAGITPMYLFMSFLPGETLDSVHKTSRLLDKLSNGKCPDIIEFLRPVHSRFGFGLCANPYPGSKFFNTAPKEGILLAKSWKDYYPFHLSFIPYSFLQDVPVKKRAISKEVFDRVLSQYKKEILYNQTHNLVCTIFPAGKNLNDYNEFLYAVLKLCDGRRTVQELCNILKSSKETTSMRETCSAIRFLAMFGLVKSKGTEGEIRGGIQR